MPLFIWSNVTGCNDFSGKWPEFFDRLTASKVCHTSFIGWVAIPGSKAMVATPHKGEDAQNSPKKLKTPPPEY
jgi:hypothetical protein